MRYPPLISTITPVVKLACSEQRNSTRSATSVGWPSLPTGISDINRDMSLIIYVSMSVGANAAGGTRYQGDSANGTILLLWASCHVNTYLRFDDVGPSHMAAVARASISAGTRPKISSHLRCRNVSFSVELVSLPGAPVSPDEAAPSMVYRAPQVFDSERITGRPHPECRQSQVPPRPAHRAVGHSRSGLGKAIDR